MKGKPTCKKCGQFNHWTYQCYATIREMPKKPVIKRKPIVAKQDVKWLATKKRWFKANPPVNGYYYCHYCNCVLTKEKELNDFGVEYVTLDHVKNRSHYALKYNIANLVPCCQKDNYLKGSMSYEAFCRKYYPRLVKDGIIRE